jgi:hypothetical protein
MSNAIRSLEARPSRYSWESTPSSSQRRPVGANPAVQADPCAFHGPASGTRREAHPGSRRAPASSSTVMSGIARQMALRHRSRVRPAVSATCRRRVGASRAFHASKTHRGPECRIRAATSTPARWLVSAASRGAAAGRPRAVDATLPRSHSVAATARVACRLGIKSPTAARLVPDHENLPLLLICAGPWPQPRV